MPKKRIWGVTSSTKFEILLVFCFVIVALFLSSFVSVLVIDPPGILQPYQELLKICQKLQYIKFISFRWLTWITEHTLSRFCLSPRTLKVCDLSSVSCDVTFFANSLPVAVRVDKNVARLSSLIRSWSTRVFETRTANGREHLNITVSINLTRLRSKCALIWDPKRGYTSLITLCLNQLCESLSFSAFADHGFTRFYLLNR